MPDTSRTPDVSIRTSRTLAGGSLRDAASRLFTSLWQHRELIRELTRREITARYRGSVLGFAWSLVTPLLMLGVYTFLFSVVFRARWGTSSAEGRMDFALILFVGLIVYNLFAECIGRAPSLILANASMVKRVVFPLEILTWTIIGVALANAGLSLAVWLVAASVSGMAPSWTALWLPVIIVPLLLITAGGVWALSALGVYLRDTGQAIGVVVSILLFLSPVFYRVEALPADLQAVLRLNPLTYFIEETRHILVWHGVPHFQHLAMAYAGGLGAAIAGLACFQRARRGFGDVL